LLSLAHFFLAQSLFDITSEVVNHVALLQNTFIDGVVVIERDERKSSWFSRVLIHNNFCLQNSSKFFKVLHEHIFGMVITNARHIKTL